MASTRDAGTDEAVRVNLNQELVMLVNLVLMLGIRAAILDIAIQDCDAFDSENVREQGVEYVCNPAGYSAELDTLCRMVGL